MGYVSFREGISLLSHYGYLESTTTHPQWLIATTHRQLPTPHTAILIVGRSPRWEWRRSQAQTHNRLIELKIFDNKCCKKKWGTHVSICGFFPFKIFLKNYPKWLIWIRILELLETSLKHHLHSSSLNFQAPQTYQDASHPSCRLVECGTLPFGGAQLQRAASRFSLASASFF